MYDDYINVLIDKVDSVAAQVQSSKSTYRNNIITNVAHCIKEAFIKKQDSIIDIQSVKWIKKKLTAYNDPYSRDSLRNYQCYNNFIERLIKYHNAQCKFINTVLKTERQLVIRIDKQLLHHIDCILIIRKHLLSMRTVFDSGIEHFTKTTISENRELTSETEYTCSFLASVVIFGLFTRPNFHRLLFHLKYENILLSPEGVTIPYKSSEVYSRYYFPFPSSAYFLRYILFHEHLHRKKHGRKVIKPSDLINKETYIKESQIAKIFKNWTQNILKHNNVSVNEGLTPPQFYKAALAVSLLSCGNISAAGHSYFPFILSVQSRRIQGYSLHAKYLHHLIPYHGESAIEPQKRQNRSKLRKPVNCDLHRAIQAVSKARMLLERLPNKLKYRYDIAANIIDIIKEYQPKLNTGDYENLSLYAKWVCHMLESWTHVKISVINDYASMVPSLLYNMSGDKPFHLQSPESRERYLSMTIHGFRNESIRDHLIYFCNYVEKVSGKKFKKPNWSSNNLRKEDMPTPKALVSFTDIDKAIKLCNSRFLRHADRLTNEFLIEEEKINASHKASAYKQIIALAFFAGLRISEILRLRLNHISYDGGIILTVRRSKTRNGIRNIPLYLLMPEDRLREFEHYISYIRQLHPYFNTHLFARRKLYCDNNVLYTRTGKRRRWKKKPDDIDLFSSTTVRKDIQSIFHVLGYHEFVFHHLRHSFANWLLLRWFAAFNRHMIPPNAPFRKYKLFSNKYLEKIVVLTLGANRNRYGQQAFSFGMAALARLMGHGGPIVTLETYIHNTDWLFLLLSRSNEPRSAPLTSKAAANFLQVTYPTLPPYFKGRGYKKVNAEDLLKHQRENVAFN